MSLTEYSRAMPVDALEGDGLLNSAARRDDPTDRSERLEDWSESAITLAQSGRNLNSPEALMTSARQRSKAPNLEGTLDERLVRHRTACPSRERRDDVMSSVGVVQEPSVTGSRTFERPDRGDAFVLPEPDRREARVERERLEREAIDQLQTRTSLMSWRARPSERGESARNGPVCRRCAPCLASC